MSISPVAFRFLMDGFCPADHASDPVALACRIHDHCRGNLGLFASEGEATLKETLLQNQPADFLFEKTAILAKRKTSG